MILTQSDKDLNTAIVKVLNAKPLKITVNLGIETQQTVISYAYFPTAVVIVGYRNIPTGPKPEK